MIQFDEHIFQMGRNHHPDPDICLCGVDYLAHLTATLLRWCLAQLEIWPKRSGPLSILIRTEKTKRITVEWWEILFLIIRKYSKSTYYDTLYSVGIWWVYLIARLIEHAMIVTRNNQKQQSIHNPFSLVWFIRTFRYSLLM